MTLDGLEEESAPATILVVDDSRISGRKLAKAAAALGHAAEIVDNGSKALALLRESPADIVLLDILMPEMDGYAVLEAMKADASLRDIPVIVISSLDDEVGSVARAIELGAEDFLPKNFDPAILRARVNASLVRKRFRDRELDYFRDFEKLTRAAQVVEAGAFRPEEMGIDAVAARNDPLGRLAVVFRGLADEIYERERRNNLTVRTLRGTLLVLAAGGIFGIAPALGRMASDLSVPSLGLVFWANLVAAAACLTNSIVRNGLPRLRPYDLVFLLAWAIVLGVLYQLMNLLVAKHIEATTIALIGSARGFMVFLLAALLAVEKPSLRRFSGLGIGFGAVVLILLFQSNSDAGGELVWVAAAFALPFLLSVHTLLMTWRPSHLDASAAVGIMLAISSVLVAPFAVAQDAFFVPSFEFGSREVVLIGLGLSTGLALTLALEIVSTAGAVFAGQMAYSQTIAGIVWGMILLGESLSPVAWASLALVIVGFWLVKPHRAGEDFRITLHLRDRLNG